MQQELSVGADHARRMRGDLVLAEDAGTGAVFDVLIPKAPQVI